MGRVTCRVLRWVKNRKNSKKINKMQLHVYRKSIIFSFFSFFFRPPVPVLHSQPVNATRPSGWSATAEGSHAWARSVEYAGHTERNNTVISVSVPMGPIRDAIRSV